MKQLKLTRKICGVLLCVVLGITAFTGCTAPADIDKNGATATAIQDFPVTVNEVTIGAKPQKVAALSASLVDVILAVGYESSLVLATNDCTQPELESLPKTNAQEIQAVIDTGADLVLANQFTADQTEAFSTAKITALTIAPAKDRADFERMYSQVGSALNGASSGYNAGVTAGQKIFTTLDDLSRIIPVGNQVITSCILTDAQKGAVTGDMIGSTVLSYSGMTNVFQGASGGTYEFEQLKMQNPDIIFCVQGIKDTLTQSSTFGELDAVKNGRVYEIPLAQALWEGRSMVSAATYFAGIAYPQLLEESSASVTLPSVIDTTPAPTADAQGTYNTLNPGDQGESVTQMQNRLVELGYLAEGYVASTFDTLTEDAVRLFQATNGMGETAIADGETQKRLFALDAIPAPTAGAVVAG